MARLGTSTNFDFGPEPSAAFRTASGALERGTRCSLRKLVRDGRYYLGPRTLDRAPPPRSTNLAAAHTPSALGNRIASRVSTRNPEAVYIGQLLAQFIRRSEPKALPPLSACLVIDLGGARKPGMPVRSLYHFQLLVMLCDEYGFHLAQEFLLVEPVEAAGSGRVGERATSPGERRGQHGVVLAKTPWPRASNRRLPQPYSDSMRNLLTNGYRAKRRPSGHEIRGEVAERLGRKWICVDLEETYLLGAKGRFLRKAEASPAAPASKKTKDGYYRIPHPGLFWDAQTTDPLPQDRGKRRPQPVRHAVLPPARVEGPKHQRETHGVFPVAEPKP